MNAPKGYPEREYKSGDRLTLQQAAELFAFRDTRPHDTWRQAVGRWRPRIQTAIKRGSLSEKSKTVEITELVSWALTLKVREQADWPLKLTGLPRKPFQDEVNEQASVNDEVYDLVLPGDLRRSHAAIRRLAEENEILRKNLSLLQLETSVLRPKAEQYDLICEKNRTSGNKPKSPLI